MAEIVGIDLGTTKSAIAVWRDGAPHIIPDLEGRTITPSIVALNAADSQWKVGYHARAIAIENPTAAINSIKRLIGRRFKEDVVQKNLEKLHILYEVQESRRRQGGIEVTLGDKHLAPQEVSAKILQELKTYAESFLGHEINQAVITVPAYFHDSQRQATRDAGQLAGLEVLRVLNEPTAACLAFGFKKLNEARKTVAVYDLGGGTFDISILEVGQGPFWVRATNGDTYLGGDDLNWLIVDWMLNEIGGEEKKRLSEDVHALALLRAEAEKAKIDLSSKEVTRVQVPGLLSPVSGVHDLDLELTRSKLEAIAVPFITKTLEPCASALHDARLRTSDIQEVLLVGGQTRMSAIRKAVRDFFGVEPNISVNPEEVVALGAAVQAAILAGEATGIKLADVVPLSLGVHTGGVMDVLIPRNTPVPFEKTKIYSTVDDNQENVEIQIYQGERPMAADNTKLRSLYLRGIGPALAGEPEIEVTFRVDQDGILHVSGKDLRTDNIKEITITDSVQLSKEEIGAMIREAQEHEAEYMEQRRQAEAQAQVERLVQRLNGLLVEKKDTLPPETVTAIQDALSASPTNDWTARLAALQDIWRQTLAQT